MTTLPSAERRPAKTEAMLRNVALVLVLLWVFALFTSFTLGGWIHLLLAAAGAAFAFGMIRTANRQGNP